MTQLLGLILLLLGMGSFFVLWLMKLNNRSKVVETQPPEPEPEPIKPAGRFANTSAYSLSPSLAAKETQAPREPAREVLAGQPQRKQSIAETVAQSEPRPALDADDSTATTHLEIASHFFDMGDFAGAIDMCQLVIDNEAASPSQKEGANTLRDRCG